MRIGIANLLSKAMGKKAARNWDDVQYHSRKKYIPTANATLKKHYSDAFNKSRARINDMNMSSAQKDDAVESLRTFYRNQHSEEMMRAASGRTYDIPPPVTPVSELVKQGLAFALGGGAGYGVAKNEEAITEMLKSTKLPTYEGLFPEEEELEEPSLGTKTGNLLIDILSPIPRSWGE